MKKLTAAIILQEFSNPNPTLLAVFFFIVFIDCRDPPKYHDFHRFHTSLSWTLQKASVSQKKRKSLSEIAGLMIRAYENPLVSLNRRPKNSNLWGGVRGPGGVVYLGVFPKTGPTMYRKTLKRLESFFGFFVLKVPKPKQARNKAEELRVLSA